MTDLKITRLCAEAIGLDWHEDELHRMSIFVGKEEYQPLHDDAQAMAVLILLLNSGKRVVLENNAMPNHLNYGKKPILVVEGGLVYEIDTLPKLRRAICECLAKIEAAKL